MDNCVFCHIIKGELPAHVVYQDDLVIAILDHRPVRDGHCMVIPKQHYDYFTNLPDNLAHHIVTIGNRLGRKIELKMIPAPMRIGFVVHGYIPHVHYHVIPQHDEDDITSGACASVVDGRVHFNAENIPLANQEKQKKIAALLSEI